MVNTDKNCSFRMLALARLSVNNSLHFSRDGTPLCSLLLDLMYDQNFLEPQPLFISKSLETYVLCALRHSLCVYLLKVLYVSQSEDDLALLYSQRFLLERCLICAFIQGYLVEDL